MRTVSRLFHVRKTVSFICMIKVCKKRALTLAGRACLALKMILNQQNVILIFSKEGRKVIQIYIK